MLLKTSNGLCMLIFSHLPFALFICDYLAWVASRSYAVLLKTSNGLFMLIVSHLPVSLLLFYLLDYFTWKLPEAMRAAKDKQRCFVLIVFSCTTSSNKFKLTPLVQRQAKWSVLWFCFLLSAMNDLCALYVF